MDWKIMRKDYKTFLMARLKEVGQRLLSYVTAPIVMLLVTIMAIFSKKARETVLMALHNGKTKVKVNGKTIWVAPEE